MQVLILGGFLGSGKTSALMQFARYTAGIADPNRKNKVIILENEVGEVGIDDVYLRSGGFMVTNLFSGCACCTVSDELVSAVSRIRGKLDPEWLIVETTGIAYPRNMRENLKSALTMDSRICIVVDASRWNRLIVPMRDLLRGQIQGSDVVIINKIDLADEDALQKVERDILEIEPAARLERISALSPVSDAVWRRVAGTNQYE